MNHNPMKCVSITTAAAASLLACDLNAAIIAFDDFSAAGSGTGWAAASDWGTGNVSGGEFSATGQNFRAFDSTINNTSGTEFWVSLDVAIASNSWGGLSFYNGSSEVLLFGRDTTTEFWGIDGSFVTDTYTTTPWVAGESVRLLGRAQYDVNGGGTPDQVSLWVNPSDTSSIAALGTADATVADNNLGPYTQVRLGTGSTGLTVDNLLIATDLASVPEPASMAAILGFTALGMVVVRRRRSVS